MSVQESKEMIEELEKSVRELGQVLINVSNIVQEMERELEEFKKQEERKPFAAYEREEIDKLINMVSEIKDYLLKGLQTYIVTIIDITNEILKK